MFTRLQCMLFVSSLLFISLPAQAMLHCGRRALIAHATAAMRSHSTSTKLVDALIRQFGLSEIKDPAQLAALAQVADILHADQSKAKKKSVCLCVMPKLNYVRGIRLLTADDSLRTCFEVGDGTCCDRIAVTAQAKKRIEEIVGINNDSSMYGCGID